MNNPNDHIVHLWNLYCNDEANEQEIDELLELLDAARKEGRSLDFIEKQMAAHEISRRMDEGAREAILDIALAGGETGCAKQEQLATGFPLRTRAFRSHWLRYAAILLVLLGAGILGIYLLNFRQKKDGPVVAGVVETIAEDAMPGADKAVLTLADGSTIILDSASDGRLANQGNAQVFKTATGELAYSVSGKEAEVLLNTMRTPRGGQYRLTLSDGTRVWLNAASSITYPAAFSAEERAVSVTGEAYFEVAKDKNKPFRVSAGAQQIEVLGTSFNINAYDDEPLLRSTLVEGSVRLSHAGHTVALRPGQQALVKGSEETIPHEKIAVVTVDTTAVTAWKNGLFNFNEARLTEAMRQLSRWYDVEISYEGTAPDLVLMGEMQRSLKLSQVLTLFKKLGVKYRIEDRELFILNH